MTLAMLYYSTCSLFRWIYSSHFSNLGAYGRSFLKMYIIYTLLQNSNFSMENIYVLVAKHYTVNNCCSFYIYFFYRILLFKHFTRCSCNSQCIVGQIRFYSCQQFISMSTEISLQEAGLFTVASAFYTNLL